MTRKTCVSSIALCMILGSFMFGQAGAVEADKWPGTKVSEATPKVPGMPAVLAKNLANFDDLDFRVYTNQQWQDLHKSHTKDVIVHWPDGHTTQGIEKHIEDLKYMWTFAPDNRIKEPATITGSPFARFSFQSSGFSSEIDAHIGSWRQKSRNWNGRATACQP